MRLSARIQQLQSQEAAEVSRALTRAREAMLAVEKKQAEYFGKNRGSSNDWLNQQKKAEVVRDDVAGWNLKEVRRAFDPAMNAIEAWLVNGSDVFFPAVRAWDEGDEDLVESLPELVRVRAVAADSFETHKTTLRSQLAFIPPVRVEVNALFTAIRAQRRVEDVEIIPSVLSGKRETTTEAVGRVAERYKTSDDVAKSLRMARPPELAREPAPEPEPPSLMASLRNLFKR
jgi:hypothetical protein